MILAGNQNLLIMLAGLQTNFEGLLKTVTYEAENTDEYKNNVFNAEAYGALSYNASLPMFKKNNNGDRN